MEVEESDMPVESSSSLQWLDDIYTVFSNSKGPEAFDDSGSGDESSTGDDAGSPTAMTDRSYCHLRPSARQFIGGVRPVELVGSECYRMPHGFQKEATSPCRPLVAHTYSPSSFEGVDVRNKMSSAPNTQVSTNSGKRGPLEGFTLMIGENILRFRIVKAPEPWSTSSACRCLLCGKMLQDESEWETHESEVHHCLSKRYRCVICNAHFGSKDSLIAHMRYHPGPRPHRCTVCTKSFRRASSLALHMKMHIMGHRHFCHICGRWFKSLSSLTDHEKTCLAMLNGDYFYSDRPFRWQCSYCDKMFHRRRDKTIHERVHTGEKPYTCEYCGRAFTQSQTLTVHIRTHTGEKPYPCGICGQKFRDSSALRKHEYRHVTIPPSMFSSLYEDSALKIEVGDDKPSSWNGGNLTS